MSDKSQKKDEASPAEPLGLSPEDKVHKRFRAVFATLARLVESSDTPAIARTLRKTNALRALATHRHLTRLVHTYVPGHGESKLDNSSAFDLPAAVKAIGEAQTEQTVASMEDEGAEEGEEKEEVEYAKLPDLDPVDVPECAVFVQLLVVLRGIDFKVKGVLEWSEALVKQVHSQYYGRRTMDKLASLAFFYYSMCFEHADRLAEIRPFLLKAHRTACMQHNEPTRVQLTNLILRNYLHYKLYTQADQFRLASPLSESTATPQQLARYLYYLGRIHCVQIHYDKALEALEKSLRKAPQHGALGFKQTATKLSVVVRLLMGIIPDFDTFKSPELGQALHPYFLIARAVRAGNLEDFQNAREQFKDAFARDGTTTLVARLHQNVIRAGLKRIAFSYSKISLKDIAEKLQLGSERKDQETDTEYLVAKAIRDGLIEAVIERDGMYMKTRATTDKYSTNEPANNFQMRIKYLSGIHDDVVRLIEPEGK